jgi:hypothetical protein
MALNIDKEVAQLQRMTVNQLQGKFAEVCGEQPRSRNKQWLIKRLAWKLQAREYGGLSERALRRAAELADACDLSDLRLTSPPPSKNQPAEGESNVKATPTAPLDRRLPMPGTLLSRKYKGQTVQVMVMADGFQFEGERYKTLSAVAKAITGSHWNGYHFFALNQKAEVEA